MQMRKNKDRRYLFHSSLRRLSSIQIGTPDANGVLWDMDRIDLSEKDPSLLPLLEQACPRSVTFAVRFGTSLYPLVYRIYSDSAFGQPSLLIRGIRNPREFREALAVCHQCYCELSEAKKEFNGYLPRGMMIDTPLALSASEPYRGCDFFCLDYDRLCCLCEGNQGVPSPETRQAIEEQLSFFLGANPFAERRILLSHLPDRKLITFCQSHHIKEIYLPSDLISRCRERLIQF